MPDSQPIQKAVAAVHHRRHLGVLSLGYTLDLWDDPNEAFGDPRQGIVGYEDRMSFFAVIAHSPRKRHLKPIRLAENAWAYPTDAFTAVDSWFRMFFMARRLAKEHRIDLIQVRESMFSGTIGYLLARRLGTPLHVCVYGTNPFDRYWLKQSWINRLVSRWAKPILRSADGIQVDGSMTARDLADAGIPAERIVVKPLVPGNLADYVAGQRDPELHAKLALNGRFSRFVLFVGRIDAQKNLQLLLDVATRISKSHPHVRFILIGDGPQRRDLEQSAVARGLTKSMLWLGWQSHHQVVKYMATCDIFALPSVYEGFARVLMEAAMAAMPIVTTTVSGSDDAVASGKNGYIVPIGDVDAFSGALLTLVDNPEQSLQMGLQSRLHVQELVSRYSDPYLQVRIWEDVISRRYAKSAP